MHDVAREPRGEDDGNGKRERESSKFKNILIQICFFLIQILSCASETDRQRWLHATEPPASENPDEKLYEQWDCPQVMARHRYVPLQPDELGLEAGDVVNVTRKMADGKIQFQPIAILSWKPLNSSCS